MNLSYALRNILRNDAFNPNATDYRFVLMNYEDNKPFNRALLLPVCKDKTFFVPIIGMDSSLELLINRLHDIKQGIELKDAYIGIGLYYSNIATLKTVPAILKLINRCHINSRLYKVDTTKGYIYYGGKGIIFDEEWHPLMIAGYNMNISDDFINVESPVLYVSPEVFTNKDIISKAIINTIIPLYTQEGIWTSSSPFSSEVIVRDTTYNKVTVIVKDINNFITTPVLPSSKDESKRIWDFLENNFSNINDNR